ncbi:MAG: transketolase [Candidatus Zixiibacteriota bacterium]
MPIVNSKTGRIRLEIDGAQLIERARRMRLLNEVALYAAGSGHSGGTLGFMDIAAALYLKIARHDPEDPSWPDRDRVVWSAGHKAPALYTALHMSGYFPLSKLMTLRSLGSPLQGHPHWRDLPGVEISSGSLGQGVSVAVGIALAAKLDQKDYRIFAIATDGEQQEGSVWEAAMSASHHKLDNLIFLIDQNRLQIDGPVSDVMNIEPLVDKYLAFGWHVISADGHNMAEIVSALDTARNHNETGKPVAVIFQTIKGKGVSFMENVVGWHGKPPNHEQLQAILTELGDSPHDEPWRPHADLALMNRAIRTEIIHGDMPKFSVDYWWNETETMKVDMQPTRKGFGNALDLYGDDPRIVCLGADISDSICISDFYKAHPERKNRFISVGIAEQNGTTIAAGLAKEGKIPVFGTYGVFASSRNLDQLRVSVCYSNLNVLIAGAHGGISVGPDGATHQELESMFQICGLPNMHMGIPCDIIETEKMTRAMLFDVVGPKYLRFAREATPVVTRPDTPFEFGQANVFRFRRTADTFAEAFSVTLARDHQNEGEAVTIISCGPELAEALRAAYILKSDFNLETRVLNMHTVKPMDRTAVLRAAGETQLVLTVEEHQIGGLGNQVAAIILTDKSLTARPLFDMIGIPDRFGESGEPWQLIRMFGLAAEHIAERVKVILNL